MVVIVDSFVSESLTVSFGMDNDYGLSVRT